VRQLELVFLFMMTQQIPPIEAGGHFANCQGQLSCSFIFRPDNAPAKFSRYCLSSIILLMGNLFVLTCLLFPHVYLASFSFLISKFFLRVEPNESVLFGSGRVIDSIQTHNAQRTALCVRQLELVFLFMMTQQIPPI
jgi:hypothetical protein